MKMARKIAIMKMMASSMIVAMSDNESFKTCMQSLKRIQNSPISMPNIGPKKSGFIPPMVPGIIEFWPPSMFITR